jgi:hypothetical protein
MKMDAIYINPAVYEKFRRDLVKLSGIAETEEIEARPIVSRPVQDVPPPPKNTAALAISTAPGQPKSAVARALILQGFEEKQKPEAVIAAIIAATGMAAPMAKNYFKNGSKQLNLPASFYS